MKIFFLNQDEKIQCKEELEQGKPGKFSSLIEE